MGSLVAEALLAVEARSPIIVDAGCGVGRVAADAARLAPGGQVIGVDASVHMLEFARQVALGTEAVPVELRDRGFEEPLLIPARSVDNLTLLRADVEQLPIAAAAVDLMLSVNVVDRLPSGPEKALAECARVLRPGGRMVFTDPLNFSDEALWTKYRTSDSIRALLEANGLELTTWFDSLVYREMLDARGSFEEFRTLVVAATRAG